VNRERRRRRYRPERVRILFVGEATPASGRFFYQADSGLYRAILDGFAAAFPDLPEADFLGSFRNLGCYLVDLCGKPVDRLDRRDRDAACRAGVARLSRIIRELQPEVIIVVVRSIAANVARAQERAEWSGATFDLPYPGRWHKHRKAFLETLIPILHGLK
jgi:hypothetical protein